MNERTGPQSEAAPPGRDSGEGSRIDNLKRSVGALERFVPSVVREAIRQDPLHPPLDRRMCDLSVLFADISGCTRLCELLPAERMQALIEGLFSSFIDEVHELGGTINEIAGDGAMILFMGGDPETHARAAARAACVMHGSAESLDADEHRSLALHIGINSGVAFLGAMEFRGKHEARATYTASGPVTNVAARLAALAPAGKTYVAEETRRRIRKAFPCASAGEFTLKNVSGPVRVFELTRDVLAKDGVQR